MGCTRQGAASGGQYLAVRENRILRLRKPTCNKWGYSKFHFRKGLGLVGQRWQRLPPGHAENCLFANIKSSKEGGMAVAGYGPCQDCSRTGRLVPMRSQ